METRAFCALLSVWRITCGLVLVVSPVELVVRCFGLIEIAMGTMSVVNSIKARDIDASIRGLLPPLIYTAGMYVRPQYHLEPGIGVGFTPQLEAALWGLVLFRVWCLASLGLSVTCGLSTFLGFKTGGPYKLVRHPMQLSGIMSRVIFCAAWPCAVNYAGLITMIVGSVAIVVAEELYLRRFEGWDAYAARVKFRLLPGVW